MLLFALPLFSQVSVITLTDPDQHSKKEDFYHTFEYYVISDEGSSSKCQATRIAPNWFATAAHCLKKPCQKSCKIRLDLLDQPVSVIAETNHSDKKPSVFVHPDFKEGTLIKGDFALFRLDLNHSPKIYYRRATEKEPQNVAMTPKAFFHWLATHRQANRQYKNVLSPNLPPIAQFGNANYVLDGKISVISIFHGKRQVQPNPHPVYYVKKLGYAYTQNFGIRKGMSGSGVMTNTGELIGIISAYVGADVYLGKKKVDRQDLFMFPVFNENLISFMQEVMGADFGRVDVKDAYPGIVSKTSKDFTKVLIIMDEPKKK